MSGILTRHVVLAGYVGFIFLLEIPTLFMSPSTAGNYLSVSIFVMGFAAVVLHKTFHSGRFLDMGFRWNRNALIGLAAGLLFLVVTVCFNYLLPWGLKWLDFERSEASPGLVEGVSPLVTGGIVFVLGTAILFMPCIFGEELAFRGYILPKMEEWLGPFKAVVVSSAVFGLWHLPAYFSVYSGGAAEEGWSSVLMMLLAHGISVVPLCILYLTTRELYGVSLYHSAVDVVQYCLVANPQLGEASELAMYKVDIINEPALTIAGSFWLIGAIPIMMALCKGAGRWTLPTARG